MSAYLHSDQYRHDRGQLDINNNNNLQWPFQNSVFTVLLSFYGNFCKILSSFWEYSAKSALIFCQTGWKLEFLHQIFKLSVFSVLFGCKKIWFCIKNEMPNSAILSVLSATQKIPVLRYLTLQNQTEKTYARRGTNTAISGADRKWCLFEIFSTVVWYNDLCNT